ncbi:MAG: MBL fold metallo-hydrolase [Planctomycetota bacterium]|jgi:glyoxylase-like metal-dependent hydrolase (beta-lactamase superfamily II)
MTPRPASILAASLLSALLSTPSQAQREVQIRTIEVTDNIFMLMGQGGNMGLCVGEDGAFLIDDQFAPLSEKIQAAVAKVSENKVKFLVNTHWHGDHTGGNENFGKAGSIIVAHENVRERMASEQFQAAFNRTVPAAPKDALPVVTFTDEVTFHWNGEEIRVFHVENAHTDGDSIIHFVGSNVFHMGDNFFNGNYPYIDLSSGGSLDGLIASTNQVLNMAAGESKIIPGHGSLGTKADLEASLHVLEVMRERVMELLEAGASVEEVVAAKPSEEFDAEWGTGFMKPDQWVGIIANSLATAREASAKKK